MKVLWRARRLRDADGNGVYVSDGVMHTRIESVTSRGDEPSGHDMNDSNVGVLSGNHISNS